MTGRTKKEEQKVKGGRQEEGRQKYRTGNGKEQKDRYRDRTNGGQREEGHCGEQEKDQEDDKLEVGK